MVDYQLKYYEKNLISMCSTTCLLSMIKVYEENVKKPCAGCNGSLNVLLIKYEQQRAYLLPILHFLADIR